MRKLPQVLAVLFLAITLSRVASLAGNGLGAGLLGWFFSAGLGAGVFISAYWLRVEALRRKALTALAFFLLCDLVFNAAEVYRHMLASGAWSDGILRVAGIIYACFPTLAAALLGWLQGGIDRLPPTPARRTALIPRIRVAAAAWFDTTFPQAAPQPAAEAQADAQAAPQTAPRALLATRSYECCGRSFPSQQSFAAHRRHCAAARAAT